MAFSAKFKQLLLRNFLPGWIVAGRTVTALYNQWKGTELGMRKQEFLKVGREVSGLMKKEKAVVAWPERELPKHHLFIETDLRRAKRYRVFARATYYDMWEDQDIEKHISFYTDSLKSKYDWEQEFMEQFGEVEEYQRYHIRGLKIGSIEHQAGAPY